MMAVLGIETSCDETSAAVVRGGRDILSNVVLTQIPLHVPFGGVVPEIACRAHTETLTRVVEEALRSASVSPEDIEAVAVTSSPGLIGSLLVGVAAAKVLAAVWEVPLIAVNHVEAHLFSPRIADRPPDYPYAGLVASGGHTALYLAKSELESVLLGRTIDDAAGEAFDKVASLLGLGYPGGPEISRAAEKGNPDAIKFPRSLLKDKGSLKFSFSGIKTAVLYHTRGQNADRSLQPLDDINVPDVAASFQEAVVDVLVEKLLRAARKTGVKHVALAGGVAANSRLQKKLGAAAADEGLQVFAPPKGCTTDNAAMIAALGFYLFKEGRTADLTLEAVP